MTNYLVPPIAPIDFSGVLTFAWVGIFLLVGMFLRSIFPPFRKYLIPACIIGGTVGFLIESTGIIAASGFGMDGKTTQLIIFHLFCLTWTYVGLRVPDRSTSGGFGSSMKIIFYYWGILITTVFLTFSGVIGSTTFLADLNLNPGPETMGSLVSYGYLTGPGQTFTSAKIIEAATSFTGLPDFALAGGAMGFAVAIILGIVLLNIIARKKGLTLISCPSQEEGCGYYNECTETENAGNQTTSNTSIDVVAWHIAIGLASYFLTYVICVFLFLILPAEMKIYVWTCFYLLCACVAVGVRTVLQKMGKEHLLCNNINTRLSNSLVDFLVCATFISIQVGSISKYWLVFLVSAVVSAVIVAVISWVYCSKLKEEGPEVFAYLFGLSTGTISTAFILLRLVDPNNKSNVPFRLAIVNILHTGFVVFMPFMVYAGPLHGFSGWTVAGIAACIGIGGMILARVFRPPLLKTAWEPTDNS